MALLGGYRNKIDAVLNATVWKDPFSAIKNRWDNISGQIVIGVGQGSPNPDPEDWTTVSNLKSDIATLLGDSGGGNPMGIGANGLQTTVNSAASYFRSTTMDRMRVGNALSEINKQVAELDVGPAPSEDNDGCQAAIAELMAPLTDVFQDWLNANADSWDAQLIVISNYVPVTSLNVSSTITELTTLRDMISGKKDSVDGIIQDAEDKYLPMIEEVKAASFITSFEDMWDDPCMRVILGNAVDTSGWGLP